MKKNDSLFVAPCYYKGTSFERIYEGISYAIHKNHLPIDIYPCECHENDIGPDELDNNLYIESQAKTIHNLIRNNDYKYKRILFIDFFNPGIELIRYISEKNNHQIKICSLMHGGTFVDGDLYTKKWTSYAEKMWAEIYNKIYVPSKYSQSQLPEEIAHKSIATGWGMDNINWQKEIRPIRQRNIDVVFPHRLSSDKGVDDLIKIVNILPDVKFVVTTPQTDINQDSQMLFNDCKNLSFLACPTTNIFYEVLNDSKIVLSCAKQELFGYSIAEACMMGCIPVLPNNQVYPELYDQKFLYSDITQCAALINIFLKSEKSGTASLMPNTSFNDLLEDFLDT